MGANSHKTIFNPEFNPGGLDAVNLSTTSRLFDNFESYADSTALQVVWTTTNVTRTLETTSPLRGAKSLKGVVTNATNQIKATINPAIFQYPFPKKLRYITFKATVDSGSASFTFKIWGSADEANNYKEWTVTPKDKYNDIIIDLDADNTESFPAPTSVGASWEPTTINRISFEDLTNGRTYYFDDIIFYYEYSIVDLVGFGTEPPVSIGTSGSIQARLNSIHADVKGLEGQTQQYAKQGIAVAEMGQALQWGLELNSDFAPPTTTEIFPGNYQIDRVRAAVTTNMVASTPASESAGTIYASYTPSETDWNVGDLIKVTFSSGYIRTDEEPSVSLTATTGAGGTTVTVANAYAFEVGWLVKIVDNDTSAEWHTIASIDSPTTFTIDATIGEFTVAQSATVNRVIQTDLSTAIFFTMLQAEAQSYKILATGTFTTSSATSPADTGRTEADNYWKGSWLMPLTGAVVNQPRLIAIFTNIGGIFTIDAEQPFTSATGLVEYIIIGPTSQVVPAPDSTSNQTPSHVVGNKADVASVAATTSLVGRLKGHEAALGIVAAGAGGGFEIDGNPSLVTALGTTGAVVTDSATSVLGAVGANNNNNAFSSTSITVNNDGSVLERLEGILSGIKALGYIGNVFFADSAKADDTGDGLTIATAKKTIDAAVNLCSANNGDIVIILASSGATFDENANTGGILMDTAQVALIGINKPEILNSNGAGTAVITLSESKCLITGLFIHETSFMGVNCTGDHNKLFENHIWGDSGHGIYINGGDYNDIYNNYLYGMGQATIAGVAVDNDANENYIHENKITNTDYAVRIIHANCDMNSIYNNLVEGAGSGTARGISIEAGNHAVIVNNWLMDCTTAIVDSGTSTDISGNHEVSKYTRIGDIPLTVESEWGKWSKFFADGDGDGATGTTLASNKSIVDALGSDGNAVTDSAVTVLGAIGANNNNNAFDSSTIVSNKDGSVLERLENILNILSSGKSDTLPSFGEFFVSEAGIQAEFWGSAVTFTGTVARDMTEAGYAKALLNCPAGNDTANLYSVQRWRIAPSTFGTNSIAQRFYCEFEFKMGTQANIDNTTTFMGFSDTQGDTRATNNIIGFIFSGAGNDIFTVTDTGGVETTNDVSAGITETNWNKAKIEAYNNGGTSTILFYLNGTLVATHITNINSAMKYINFYMDADVAGASAMHISSTRCWYQDE